MQDRHLFHGKRLDNGEWIKGSLLRTEPLMKRGKQIHNGETLICKKAEIKGCGYCVQEHWTDSCDTGGIAVDPATIGQCTGELDNQGILIYEHDILGDEDGGTCVVVWNAKRCCWGIKFAKSDFICHLEGVHVVKGVKIIGNIHDNPEMLKT